MKIKTFDQFKNMMEERYKEKGLDSLIGYIYNALVSVLGRMTEEEIRQSYLVDVLEGENKSNK